MINSEALHPIAEDIAEGPACYWPKLSYVSLKLGGETKDV